MDQTDTKPFPPIAVPPPVRGPSDIAEADDATVPTKILVPAEAQRLTENSGMTLQWIDWDQRGELIAEMRDGELLLNGEQRAQNGGPGRLSLAGRVTEIGKDYFILAGQISITDAPDVGRNCLLSKSDMRFEVTQGRKYWRLREFEWCDGLTDYVDIYF